MNGITDKLATRFRLGALLIGIGLLVEAITLSWSHPLSFVTFIMLSGGLIGIGVVLYLWTLVSTTTPAGR